jgi:5-deoxy-D-glucuronate isomerase
MQPLQGMLLTWQEADHLLIVEKAIPGKHHSTYPLIKLHKITAGAAAD